MQIRTALAIGAGLTIGIVTGMCVSEDTKYKIAVKIRNRLIHSLGGEEKKKYTTFGNPTYHTTYATYNEKYQGRQRMDIPDPKLLEFDNYESAGECVEKMKKHINTFGILSVIDLAHIRDRVIGIDYTWDAYGWTKEDFIGPENIVHSINGKCVLDLPRPKLLKI